MIEAVEGLRFLDTRLRNDTPFMASVPGGVWHGLKTDLPEDAFPEQLFCVYQHLAGADEVAGGSIRVGTTNLYLVKIVGPGSKLEGIETAAGLMDALLSLASGTTATGTIYYFVRQTAIIQPELVNGKLTLSAVHTYRSFVQKTGS